MESLLETMMLKEALPIVLFGVACYGFGALSVTADELYGIGLRDQASGQYFWPIIGARGLWDSWVFVFGGMGVCFFLAVLSILVLQQQTSVATTSKRTTIAPVPPAERDKVA